nr:hypothetical protein [Tanacetum cinerariifolium]
MATTMTAAGKVFRRTQKHFLSPDLSDSPHHSPPRTATLTIATADTTPPQPSSSLPRHPNATNTTELTAITTAAAVPPPSPPFPDSDDYTFS